MAGHSQFKNIMHRKGAQDKKRAKVFTKIIRELTVAARQNPDPEANPRLRAAVTSAKSANMPKETMERAIKKGSGAESGDNYEEVRYEGYGPGGTAFIVEALTDNRNRTGSDVRAAFSKFGGNLGETNCVAFMFSHIGEIRYSSDGVPQEKVFEAALEAGGEDVREETNEHVIETAFEQLYTVRDELEKKLGLPQSSHHMWKPHTTVDVNHDTAVTLMKLIDALEDSDDVQNVFGNYALSEDVAKSLSERF